MNMWIPVQMAFKNIRASKMRSFLTMLGIIIGVSSVIALVSMAQGSTKSVTDQVQSLGSNLVTISILGRGNTTTIPYEEAMQWKNEQGIKAVSPVISGSAELKNGTTEDTYTISGVTPEYETVQNFHPQSGRFILPIDLTYRQKVVLLGTDVSKEMFGFSNPVGQKIQINGIPFTVVGLLESKGSTATGNYDDSVLIPISTAERVLFTKGVKTVSIQAKTPQDVNTVVSLMESLLNRKFNNDTNAFQVFNQQDMLSTVSSVTNTMTLMLVGIAGISLLVGGIGIMNIMLVSVTERTKEIGIRKALGAKRKDILFLFLVESVVLTSVGGILGIGLGIGASYLLSHFTGNPVSISLGVSGLSFAFSVLIGIIFGILPANKAAKLNPIEALRFE